MTTKKKPKAICARAYQIDENRAVEVIIYDNMEYLFQWYLRQGNALTKTTIKLSGEAVKYTLACIRAVNIDFLEKEAKTVKPKSKTTKKKTP